MSRSKGRQQGLLSDTDDPSESDPPGLHRGNLYGSNSISVAVQQPGNKGKQFTFVKNGNDVNNGNDLNSPVSSPSSDDDVRRGSFTDATAAGKTSRLVSETRLLVPDQGGKSADDCDVTVKLFDPDTAGDITLWNGVRIKATEFIFKEKCKREVEKPPSDLFCCLRVWSILGHFGVLVCLPLLLWLLLTRTGRALEESVENEHMLWFTTPVALCAIFAGLSYLLILCEAFTARSRPYMANLMSLQEAQGYVSEMRNVAPRILLKVRCYHFEESNIGSKPCRKLTHEETREFIFSRCHDLSGYLQPEDYPSGYVSKVKMRRVFGFLDEETEQKYKMFKNSVIDRNSNKDACIDVEEVMEVEGLQEKISVYLDAHKPRFVEYKYYWLSALCFLTLPYRYWFSARMSQTSYSYIKLIGS